MRKPLKVVHCHQAPFVTGVGNLKPTLVSDNKMKLSYTEDGVYAEATTNVGLKVYFVIPLANVISATLAEDPFLVTS